MTENFKSVLENILKKDKRLVDDSGELNGNLIHEYASSLDEGLIELLLNEEATREKFFLKVKDVYVFKQNDFKFFLDENKIDNSYTQYANRIGLSTGGKFLKDIDDVVLDFPYKDCVLEGGQSTEEGTDTYFEYDENEQDYIEKEAKRKEIFFNQILAKDEIDRLTEPKAFTNIKRYTKKGEEKITSFNRDAKEQITDNLIIKGNNLLALHALKEQFQGKIKLIYIDPPYYFKEKLSDDAFAYNSNFKLSTWCTFMLNRIKVAYDLLSNDGFMAVQIKQDGHPYLRLIMDNVFGNQNLLNDIVVKMSESSGVKMSHVENRLPNIKEYILFYRKSKNQKIKPVKIEKGFDEAKLNKYLGYYKKVIKNPEDNVESWNIVSIEEYLKEKKTSRTPENIRKFQLENANRVVYRTNNKSFSKLNINKKLTKIISKTGIEYIWWEGKQMLFLSDYIEEYLCDLWVDISTINLNKEGGVDLDNGKKPEKLLQRLIEMTTNEGDIVLDYHVGSGTTAAVAHKLKRKFVACEQLDYGNNDSLQRLKNVLKGEKSGISSEINWKGGGSFVYCELAKNNQKAIDKIMSCNSLEELIALFDELYEKYFLNYNVKVKEFKEKIIKEKEFQNLSIDRQKVIFARMLDLNQLYVNVSDMEDSQFKLSDEDIALTKNFYQL